MINAENREKKLLQYTKFAWNTEILCVCREVLTTLDFFFKDTSALRIYPVSQTLTDTKTLKLTIKKLWITKIIVSCLV